MTDGQYALEQSAIQLDGGLWLLDLGFQGRGGVIATYLLVSETELALIETGPSSTLTNLERAVKRAGFSVERITKILVTHIHFDHAGAAGPMARANSDIQVFVHPLGARHLIDPSRLYSSASRIYGDQMHALWGEVVPIPEAQVRILADGERFIIADREIEVIFTPGHAIHHVVYWDASNATAFTGDVGGVRMRGTDYCCPPTPPPDLDIPAWQASVQRLKSLSARRLCLSHFGQFDDAVSHLEQLEVNLKTFTDLGFDALQRGLRGADVTGLLHDHMAARLGPVSEETLVNLEWATPSYMATLGLTRVFEKRAGATG